MRLLLVTALRSVRESVCVRARKRLGKRRDRVASEGEGESGEDRAADSLSGTATSAGVVYVRILQKVSRKRKEK